MKKPVVLCFSRTPHVGIYEGFTELLNLFVGMGCEVEIVLPADVHPGEPAWSQAGVTPQWVTAPAVMRSCRPISAAMAWEGMKSMTARRPRLLVGADPLGNIVAAGLSRLTRRPYLYHGLELPNPRARNMGARDRLEHWSCRVADLIVTMDDRHADFISAHTGADRHRVALLPNALRGPGRLHRHRLLRDRLGIASGDIIVVHPGGIGRAQASLELARAAERWRPGRHLVFHAHCRMDNEPYFAEFRGAVGGMERVHLSDTPLPQDRLDELIGSADIGIAWYDRTTLGHRAELLGLAAGKIGRYLRNGVPVIATNLPSVREYVDEYRCGICVDRLEETEAAIDSIMSDYDTFCRNALRCYEDLWRPDRHLAELQGRLERLLAA